MQKINSALFQCSDPILYSWKPGDNYRLNRRIVFSDSLHEINSIISKAQFQIQYAVERRRLKSNLRETEAQLKWSQGLLDISKAMISSLNSEEVAREICDQTRRLIPNIDFFYIAAYDELSDEVRFLHTFDHEKPVETPPRNLSDSKNWGLTGYIIKNLQQLLCYDDLENETNNLPVPRLNGGKPSRTYIGIPLYK